MTMTMAQRLEAIAPRLRRQLDRLYPSHDRDALWGKVAALLHARAAERPAAMQALDAARVADPDWFVRPDMLGYSTYVDRFGGTVAGAPSALSIDARRPSHNDAAP